MSYTDSPIEEIKQRLDVVDILREYITLQQAGTNWRARCPFHNEKTPSFMVSKEKQIWHCFGCGKGGDIIEFVKEIEGIEFPEALRILAQKAGVVLKKQDPKMISVKTRLLDLMAEAENFFVDKLGSSNGEQARNYLIDRGLTNETLKEWQIGWAPDLWDELGAYLRSKGFTGNQILASGMIVNKQSGAGYYDRFRGRIMFPIKDINDNVVGFTGRILVETDKSGGKYINTPQTALYDKSRVIFGLNKAKQEIRKKDLAVVVEGQMDVVASHQAKVCNVVASSGTALTGQQIEIISRYTKNLCFCFDADSAGEQATKRGIDTALSLGMNVKIIQIKGAKDPDELIKNKGAENWQKNISEAVMIMKYYFDLTFGKVSISDITGKREVARQLLGEIAKLRDRIEQDFWVRELSNRLDIDEKVLRESVKNIEVRRQSRSSYVSGRNLAGENISSIASSGNTKESRYKAVILGERIIGCGLKFPEILEIWNNSDFDINIFGDEKLIGLAKNLIIYYNQDNNQKQKRSTNAQAFDYDKFKKALSLELREYADVLVMLAEKDFKDLDSDEVKEEIRSLVAILRKEEIIRRLKGIEKDLMEAEKGRDKGKMNEFSKKIGELMEQLGSLG